MTLDDRESPVAQNTAPAENFMKHPRERIRYSAIVNRPPLRLPDGARLVVWPVVNVEEWEITRPMARQASGPPMGVPVIPDYPNWTWHEYGMRVGFWRIRDAFRRFGITPTLSLNAAVCDTCPDVPAAARDDGWEFMAHCMVQMPISQIEDQRGTIKATIETIERLHRQTPPGLTGARAKPDPPHH